MTDLVLVTGASRGLGLAIVRRLLAQNYRVLALSRSKSPELDALLAQEPAVKWKALDLKRHESFQKLVADLESEFGPIYGLINNAAVAHDGVLAIQHDSEIIEQIMVNVVGTTLFTKYVTRMMLPLRRGRVINIASIIGFTGYSGLSVYAATKAAMLGFTRSLSRELGRVGITVNAIAPGYMETEMTAGLSSDQLDRIRRRSALHTLVSPDQVAAAVNYLLSEDAKVVTGTTITVDAGNTA